MRRSAATRRQRCGSRWWRSQRYSSPARAASRSRSSAAAGAAGRRRRPPPPDPATAVHLYEGKHGDRGEEQAADAAGGNAGGHEETEAPLEDGALAARCGHGEGRDAGGHNKDAMHIVGMRAHAAAHRHSHEHGHDACDGAGAVNGVHGHGHDEEPSQGRHVAAAQVLNELPYFDPEKLNKEVTFSGALLPPPPGPDDFIMIPVHQLEEDKSRRSVRLRNKETPLHSTVAVNAEQLKKCKNEIAESTTAKAIKAKSTKIKGSTKVAAMIPPSKGKKMVPTW